MADQTVPDTPDLYDYSDARLALRKTSQAMALMRAVALAVEAQEDGAVRYDNNKFSRWGPVVDGAIDRVQAVRDAMLNKASSPDTVDWWTSLAILEATGAALWYMAGSADGDTAMEAEQLQSISEAAIDSLGSMFQELSNVADELSGSAA